MANKPKKLQVPTVKMGGTTEQKAMQGYNLYITPKMTVKDAAFNMGG